MRSAYGLKTKPTVLAEMILTFFTGIGMEQHLLLDISAAFFGSLNEKAVNSSMSSFAFFIDMFIAFNFKLSSLVLQYGLLL